MIRTFAMPAELMWRATPRRWAAVLLTLGAAGVAAGFVVAGSVCGPDCQHP